MLIKIHHKKPICGALFEIVGNFLPPFIQMIRLVAISDLDEQACGGTYVQSTKEIGSFSIDKIKNKGPHHMLEGLVSLLRIKNKVNIKPM